MRYFLSKNVHVLKLRCVRQRRWITRHEINKGFDGARFPILASIKKSLIADRKVRYVRSRASYCSLMMCACLSSEVIYMIIYVQLRLYNKNTMSRASQSSPGLLQDFSNYSRITTSSPERYLERAFVECRSSVCSSGPSRCQFRPSLADRGSERKFPICPTVRISNSLLDNGRIFQLPVIVEYQALSKSSIFIFLNILNYY